MKQIIKSIVAVMCVAATFITFSACGGGIGNAKKAYQNGDYKKAFELLSQSNNLDNEGKYLLGECYLNGQGTTKDKDKAIHFFTEAADGGYIDAQRKLASYYKDDYNLKEAFKWNLKLAEQGDTAAQYQVANEYMVGYGSGVERDIKEACKWLEKAANQGHIAAMEALGEIYLKERSFWGNTVDYDKGFSWSLKAAERGNASAQCNVGWCYQYGYGVAQDDRKAEEWFIKAAENGERQAVRNLAINVRDGKIYNYDKVMSLIGSSTR